MAGAVVGALGTIYAAKQAQKAQNKAAQAQSKAGEQYLGMVRPYTEAGAGALTGMQRIISQYLMPRLGKESPILAGQYRKSISDIGRTERRGIASSTQYYRASGNIGRARGETLRIGQSATEARNLAGLGYGAAQEDYKRGTEAQVLAAQGGIANLGGGALGEARAGLQMGVAGAGMKAQGVSQFWGDLAGALGGVVGSYEEREQREDDRDWLQEMLRQYGFGSPGTSGGGGGGPSSGGGGSNYGGDVFPGNVA